MKRTLLFSFLILWIFIGSQPADNPPQVQLSNGLIETTLYLPDTAQGYYRGTRFDWTGAFKNLDYAGHSFVNQWFETYNPRTHDAINGPAEEFVALGFANAKPGESFVKIGVGVLTRPDDRDYSFATNYAVLDYGTRTVKRLKNGQAVAFTHTLTDKTGYGYAYTKTVRLTKGKPELVLEHRLKNTGQKPIETSVYNHNFWIIDGEPTGPGIEISFPYSVRAEGKGFGDIIKPDGNKLIYSRPVAKGEYVYSAGLQGFGPTRADYDIWIKNGKTGAGVRATADQPLEKLVYWACATTSCPEPYIRLKVAPGETAAWTIRYEFYQKAN